jgi:hypothetical protein
VISGDECGGSEGLFWVGETDWMGITHGVGSMIAVLREQDQRQGTYGERGGPHLVCGLAIGTSRHYERWLGMWECGNVGMWEDGGYGGYGARVDPSR